MKVYKCYAPYELRDNNNGYLYGVKWFDNNDNFVDIEWFKTKVERDNSYNELLKETK